MTGCAIGIYLELLISQLHGKMLSSYSTEENWNSGIENSKHLIAGVIVASDCQGETVWVQGIFFQFLTIFTTWRIL